MWIFNLFLYLVFLMGMWTGDFNEYDQFVAAGAPCYEAVGAPTTPQPICFYDPSNVNPGQ